MTRSRISYNIHAQAVRDIPRLTQHLMKIQPTLVMGMDGLGLIRDLQKALPATMFIHRNYGITNGDDDVHLKVTPEWWLELRAKESEGGIYLYTTNEPAFDDKSIQWHVDLMELAAKRGVKLVIGNWGVGNPGPDDWGRAKRMLELLDQHRDLFMLGLHEYACGIITSGLYGGYPNQAGVQPGEYGGKDLIPPRLWPDDVSKITLWHCGRFNFLVKACEKMGIKPPRIVLTEHGFDDVSDIKGWAEHLDKTPGYTSIRGWKSLKAQWDKWFNPLGWSAERAYFEQLAWADQKIYQGSAVEGQCVFAWGHTSERWEQFDVAEAFEFQERLEEYAKVEDATPPPVVAPPEEPVQVFKKPTNATKKYTVQSLNGMNVRTGPAVLYPKISTKNMAEIQPGNYVRFWVVPETPKSEWLWAYCQIVTGDHALEEGWVYLAEFQYKEASTREIPVVKPPVMLQSHTFAVKIIAPAPNGDVLADWLRKQLEGAGLLFKNLDQVSNVQFEVEEIQP